MSTVDVLLGLLGSVGGRGGEVHLVDEAEVDNVNGISGS